MSGFDHILQIRDRGGVVVLDGAMGTELEARGARMDDEAWCALANLREPELVRAIHGDHIRAGADVVITNTFMSGVGPMERAGAGDQFERGIRSAVELAREAVQSAATERPVAIAGSVGVTRWGRPPVDPADGRPEHEQLRDGYARQVELLADGGVDLIALEMVVDSERGQAAVQAALDSGLPVWLGLSVHGPASRDQSDYESLPELEPEGREIADACMRDSLDAINVMHTDIDDVADALAMVRSLWPGVLGTYPHRGRWAQPNWTFVDVPTEELAELAESWIGLGATMLGGCCGLRTHHVAALRAMVDARSAG